jgi:hypothetical protein
MVRTSSRGEGVDQKRTPKGWVLNKCTYILFMRKIRKTCALFGEKKKSMIMMLIRVITLLKIQIIGQITKKN